jgi:hypothetical protein
MQTVLIGHVAGKPILKRLAGAHSVDNMLLEDVVGPVIALYAEWFEGGLPTSN